VNKALNLEQSRGNLEIGRIGRFKLQTGDLELDSWLVQFEFSNFGLEVSDPSNFEIPQSRLNPGGQPLIITTGLVRGASS
jgi:hypothetical protein